MTPNKCPICWIRRAKPWKSGLQISCNPERRRSGELRAALGAYRSAYALFSANDEITIRRMPRLASDPMAADVLAEGPVAAVSGHTPRQMPSHRLPPPFADMPAGRFARRRRSSKSQRTAVDVSSRHGFGWNVTCGPICGSVRKPLIRDSTLRPLVRPGWREASRSGRPHSATFRADDKRKRLG